MPPRPRPDADELGLLALAAARAGSTAIAEVLQGGALQVSAKSASHDLVTAADRASERAVLEVLRTARPDDAVLAEESGAAPGSSGVRWLVDPLDGTANFVHGRSDHAVSVGAEVDGELLAGAVVRPADGRWAATGAGGVRAGAGGGSGADAREGTPGGLTRPDGAGAALVTFGLPLVLEHRRQVLTTVAGLVPHVRGVRIIGSAACDFLALATGESDAAVTVGLAEWDVAAGLALTTAAGGSWTRVPLGGGLTALVAGSPAVVEELAGLLAGSAGARGSR